MNIPGLSEALGKLDTTSTQMGQIVDGLNEIANLLREQNALLSNIKDNS